MQKIYFTILFSLGFSALSLDAAPLQYQEQKVEVTLYGSYLHSGPLTGSTDITYPYVDQEITKAYNSAVDAALGFPMNLALREPERIPDLFETERRTLLQSLYPSPLNYPLLLDQVDSQAEIDNVYGEGNGFTATTGGFQVKIPTTIESKRLLLLQTIDYRRSKVVFDRVPFLNEPGGAAFDLEDAAYNFAAYAYLKPRIYWGASLKANLGREYGASPKGAGFPEGDLGFFYELSPRLEIGLGASYSYLGGEGELYPFFVLTWRPSQRVEIDVSLPEYVRAKYWLNEQLALGAGISTDGGVYRMKDERNDLSHSSAQAEFSLEFYPRENLRLEFTPAYVFYNSYVFYRDGVAVQEYDGDGGAGFTVAATLVF